MKIGTDIIAINRIEKALEKFGDSFKERFLCEDEIKLTKRAASIAGFWAAKEAISKAFGCGIGSELERSLKPHELGEQGREGRSKGADEASKDRHQITSRTMPRHNQSAVKAQM